MVFVERDDHLFDGDGEIVKSLSRVVVTVEEMSAGLGRGRRRCVQALLSDITKAIPNSGWCWDLFGCETSTISCPGTNLPLVVGL